VILNRSSTLTVFWYGALPPTKIGWVNFKGYNFCKEKLIDAVIGLKKLLIEFPLGIFPYFFFE